MGKKTNTRTYNENGKGWSIQLWVAVITGIVTVVVALIGLIGTLAGVWASSKPTDSPSPVPTFSLIIATFDTPSTELSPTETETPVPPTSTSFVTPGLSTGMHASLIANQTSGRPPLKVRFDARDSYLRVFDGIIYTTFKCGACEFFWQIRQDGPNIFGPSKEIGVFDYTFKARGTYYVSVYVCRSGSDTECAGSGTQIVVE